MTLTTLALRVLMPVLAISILLVFVRLVRGPSLADRVVALDMLGTVGIAMAALYSIAAAQPVFLDVATVLALTLFLGTIAFAFYLEKRGRP
jgi:multicomponent Na+:H+ antiporter subunit F